MPQVNGPISAVYKPTTDSSLRKSAIMNFIPPLSGIKWVLGSSNDIRFTVIVSPEHLWEYIMP
jgi:hypothetical protein